MKPLLLPAAIAAVTMSIAAAQADTAQTTTTEGTVMRFDMKTDALFLEGEGIFHFRDGFADPGLKVGETVAVTWEQQGPLKIVDDLKITG